MVPEYFRSLPLHVLVIHATVVLLPLTAIALVLAAFSSAIRRRLGIVLPLAGVLSVPLVFFTIETGQQYKDTLDKRGLVNKALNEHADIAEQVLPWAIGLAVMTIAVYAMVVLARRLAPRSVGAATTATRPTGTRGASLAARSPLSIVIAVLSVAVAAGLIVTIINVGELGARAVYSSSG